MVYFVPMNQLTPGMMPVITRRSRETQVKRIHFLQEKLQAIVMRAVVGGHIPPIESAISIYVSEGKSKPKDILDTFPETVNLKVNP
jgi:hypothetical protein